MPSGTGMHPTNWSKETPPEGCSVVPMASMDIMSFSYASRETLAKDQQNPERHGEDGILEGEGGAGTGEDPDLSVGRERPAGACFDRDKNHRVLRTMTHNNLRAMYWNSFTQQMADRFVNDHLLNPGGNSGRICRFPRLR